MIGDAHDLTYATQMLGEGPAAMQALVEAFRDEKAEGFAAALRGAKKPMVIVGQGALARPDGAAVLAGAWTMADAIGALSAERHGFNVLHTAAARVGALDLGFATGKTLAEMMLGAVDLLWLLGADEFDTHAVGTGTFVVYQGHHGDRGAARADVILPGAAYTEKNGVYVNTEGRVQHAMMATTPPGDAREDWSILRAFSAAIGRPLPYDDLAAVREKLVEANPVFGRIGYLPRFGCSDRAAPAPGDAALGDAPFVSPIGNYYQTDPIGRASVTMAACTDVSTPALTTPSPALAAE